MADRAAAIPVWNGVGRLGASQQQMWPKHESCAWVRMGARGTKRRPGWAPRSHGMLRAALLNPSKRRMSGRHDNERTW